MPESDRHIAPISTLLRHRVSERTREFVGWGGRILERRFDLPGVRFDLRGRAAGQFRMRGDWCLIRYNPWVFAVDFDHHLAVTVPHEVAHYLVYRRFGRVRPHGREWQQLMRAFGVDPRPRGDYAIDGVPVRQQRRHPYRCRCREHQLSSTRHNRARGGVRYYCRDCGERLVYIE